MVEIARSYKSLPNLLILVKKFHLIFGKCDKGKRHSSGELTSRI